MSDYYVKRLDVRNLWGNRDFDLTFHSDVNILVGPNASGKTTILNLLHHILTVDLAHLGDLRFSETTLQLSELQDRSECEIRVLAVDDGFEFYLNEELYELRSSRIRQMSLFEIEQEPSYPSLEKAMQDLTSVVWLPVSRRLPIAEVEEYRRELIRHARELESRLESVDARLRRLLDQLKDYRLGLDSELSDRYEEFEKNVLQMILYSEELDQRGNIPLDELTDQEKDELLNAFRRAGLLDQQMQNRIEEHFRVARQAIARLSSEEEGVELGWLDFSIIPLIVRTRSVIKFARELETAREEIFETLCDYEDRVNQFLRGKEVKVGDNGDLIIKSLAAGDLTPYQLSSGEKQILILLTQALVSSGRPTVYMVDEPELSLHVSWQEKLLESLRDLAERTQIIVATHSPDIVGPFIENVIDLAPRTKCL